MRTLAENHIAGGGFMEGGRRWHGFGDWTPGSDMPQAGPLLCYGCFWASKWSFFQNTKSGLQNVPS